MIYGVQAARKGGQVERLSGGAFYQLFRLLTGLDQPDNIVTARLMSRRYVDALVAHRERELNIGGLWIITGFKQSRQIIQKLATSPTTYSLRGSSATSSTLSPPSAICHFSFLLLRTGDFDVGRSVHRLSCYPLYFRDAAQRLHLDCRFGSLFSGVIIFVASVYRYLRQDLLRGQTAPLYDRPTNLSTSAKKRIVTWHRRRTSPRKPMAF